MSCNSKNLSLVKKWWQNPVYYYNIPLYFTLTGKTVHLHQSNSTQPVKNSITMTCFDLTRLTHIWFNGMSNRLLCPISFGSKMWNWSPVIWKVECIKVEDIKIGLLWCFNILPVNYYSISKQEGLKFGFNTKQFIKPKKHTNCTWVWVKFGSGFKSSTCYNHNKCMFTQ